VEDLPKIPPPGEENEDRFHIFVQKKNSVLTQIEE
jgi:hypothetical protein